MQILKNEKLLFFICGIAASLAGLHALKSGKARKACVMGLAAGMKLQKQAQEAFVNIKEEAVDICHDAAKGNGK